jgi:hypothetical protein
MSDPLDTALKVSGRRHAMALCESIVLAAETAPDVLREALSKVFSLQAVEESAKRSMLFLTEIRTQATEAKELLLCIHKGLDDVEARFDAVNRRIDRAALLVSRLEKRLTNAAALHQQLQKMGVKL